jgi:hypothetical protein
VCLLLAKNHSKQHDTKGTYLGSKKCVPNEDLSSKTSFLYIENITNNDHYHVTDLCANFRVKRTKIGHVRQIVQLM